MSDRRRNIAEIALIELPMDVDLGLLRIVLNLIATGPIATTNSLLV